MKKEGRPLRVGVLGCGPISQIAHFDACRKARNAELYAICDTAEDLRARAAGIHEPRVVYAKYEEMLADPQVEAVIIATSDAFHVPLAARAVEAGKHVLVEKPLGVSVEECEALRSSLRKSRLVFQIGHNRRFDPGVEYAARFVREEIGGLIGFKGWYYDSTYRYTMTDNLQAIPMTSAQAVRPGGNPKADKPRYFLLTHASHLVDTARFLAGELVSVRARRSDKFGSYCWFVEVEFADGCLGHIDLAIPVRGDFEEGFQIFGEHGSAQGKVFLPWFHKTSVVECFSARDGQFRRPLGEDAHTYKRQIEGFAETILDGKRQHGANIDDGVAGMRALAAIAESVRTGGSVRLDQARGGV